MKGGKSHVEKKQSLALCKSTGYSPVDGRYHGNGPVYIDIDMSGRYPSFDQGVKQERSENTGETHGGKGFD